MTSEREEQPAAPQHHHGGPGQTLAAQREAMGWTVEQVAEQLKLAVRQVVALEAGDFASLPSPAVTRGFVRAYAKILKLDAAPLVAQIEMDTPPTPDGGAPSLRRERPASFSEVRFPSHGRRSALPLGWIAAAVAVLAAGVAAWHFGLIPVLQRSEPAAPASSAPVPAPAVEMAAPAASGSASEALQSASVPLISVPAPAPEGAPAPAAGAATPAGVGSGAPADSGAAPAPAPAADPAAAAPAAAGPNQLVFKVSEDTWLDVRPAKGGKPLIARMVKAGSTETFSVSEPVKVVVGNTHGVAATLRGGPVELPGKTARITLK